MATAVLAKRIGMTVLSTTRTTGKAAALTALGVDHVVIDDGRVAHQVRGIVPDGVDAALELVGTPTLPDTLAATRVHGVVCFTGMLSNQWTVPDFYPIDYLPRGVRLTAYSGGASDLPASVLQISGRRRSRPRAGPGASGVPVRRDPTGTCGHGSRHRNRKAGRAQRLILLAGRT